MMIRRYSQLLGGTVALSCALPLLIWAYSIMHVGAAGPSIEASRDRLGVVLQFFETTLRGGDYGLSNRLIGLLVLTTMGGAAAFLLPRWASLPLERLAREQRAFLDLLPGAWVGAGIVSSAALSLLLELTLIRWQGAVFEVFAFYKNFGLLACFAGLGLGYALSHSECIPLVASIPALAWQVFLLTITRSGPAGWDAGLLRSTPVLEQLNMGSSVASHAYPYVSLLLLLAVTFMLTALAFLPIGQACGALMNRTARLSAYGLNLGGSLAGVALSLALSFAWTPPAVWFAACLLLLLPFLAFDERPLLGAAIGGTLILAILSWPLEFPWSRIHSPYQLLEVGPDDKGHLTLRAAGHYYQRILDLSDGRSVEPDGEGLGIARRYYELPYRIAGEARDIAVVGAGTGNDVAAAIRMGARSIDAVEIDPAILALGRAYHHERPYQDQKVRAIINDARSYLRRTDRTYDMIVYGLLDSHTMLSHGTNVRLDSFVYTVEGFREARERLRAGGLLSLSFSVLSPEIGRKVYLMLQSAFDGQPPVCVSAGYDGSVIFLQRKGEVLTAPAGVIESSGFSDVSSRYADTLVNADVSTDDWPFFYMPRRSYPVSYIGVVALMVLLSLGMTTIVARVRPHRSQLEFFLLGAGFMLVETKNITELGLTFGNTWQVIGIVIAGILTMGFVANSMVGRLALIRSAGPYLLLLASLTLGLGVALRGGFASSSLGRLEALLVLSSPLFFSGLVFSTALRRCDSISDAMAANLVGAMVGGLLEYNSMYFGFAFMYWIALGVYAVAMLASLLRLRSQAGEGAVVREL